MIKVRPAHFLIFMIMTCSMTVAAQVENFAATARIIEEEILFIRSDSQNELTLNPGAVTVFGIGDTIRTGSNGRVFISFSETDHVLLLADSEFRLDDYSQQDNEPVHIESTLTGIAVHQFRSESFSYQLHAGSETFSIETMNDGEQHFAVWSVSEILQAVTLASGEIRLTHADDLSIELQEHSGYAFPYSEEIVAIESPFHASQVIGRSIGCRGLVNTNGSNGLRLRAGAALDYAVAGLQNDGDQVYIAGITENGLWNRIATQSGFGWMYSSLLVSDCDDLPVFPDLFGERPEQIRRVTDEELLLLETFYGNPLTNPVFYR